MIETESNRTTRTDRLLLLQHACTTCAREDEGAVLRQAASHMANQSTARLARISAMIDRGACESAALAIVGEDTAFMLSRGTNGHCLASVACPSGEDVTAGAPTVSLALLAAYAGALLARSQASGIDRDQHRQEPGALPN